MKLKDRFLYVMKEGFSKDEKTLRSYKNCLNEMEIYMFNGEDMTIELLNTLYAEDFLIKWLKVKEKEGLKASSLNQRISCVRSLYRWLIGRGEIKGHDVSKSIPTFKNTTHETKEILTVEECWKFLDIAAEEVAKNENYNTLRDLLICQLFLGCGLRISEVEGLNISCFDLDNRKLNLTETKFDKFRTVSIPDEVIYTFTKYLAYRLDKYENLNDDMKDVLFISRKFNRLSKEQIHLDLKRILDLCKFDKHITAHSLRHSYGTLMLQSGNTLEDIAKEMGHSNINTLINYYYHKDNKNIAKSNPVFSRRNKKERPETQRDDNVIQIRFA